MKVRELIEELQKLNQDVEVINDVNDNQVVDEVFYSPFRDSVFITFKDIEE